MAMLGTLMVDNGLHIVITGVGEVLIISFIA